MRLQFPPEPLPEIADSAQIAIGDATEARLQSIENPSVPLSAINAESDLWFGLTGNIASSSGVSISVAKALGHSPIWRGANLLASCVAKIPLIVYRRLAGGGKEKATDHPLYRLLKLRPNQYMSAFDFWRTLVVHMVFTGRGNSYSYIDHDPNTARVRELLILDPQLTEPKRINGNLYYKSRQANGQSRVLSSADVLHFRGLSYDGVCGYDIVGLMRDAIGLGIASREFASAFFKRGATPTLVLERPTNAPRLSPNAEENLRKRFDNLQAGLPNAHTTAVTQEGTVVKALGIDAEKSQLVETRQLDVREVANILGMPPHKLGDPTRTAYASLEQEQQAFLDDSLDPLLTQIEQECTIKLLTEEEQEADEIFVEFNRDAIVRVDLKTQVESLTREVTNGLLSLDEARAIRNRPPLPDGKGRIFYVPANLQVVGQPPKPTEPQAPQDPVEPELDVDDIDAPDAFSAHRDLLVATLDRIMRRVAIFTRKPDHGENSARDRQRSICVQMLLPAYRAAQSLHLVNGITPAGVFDRCAQVVDDWLAAGGTGDVPAELRDQVFNELWRHEHAIA